MDDLKQALQADTLYPAEEIASLRAYAETHPSEALVFGDKLLAELCYPFLTTGKAAYISVFPETDDSVHPLLTAAERAVEMLQSAIRREETKPHTFKYFPDIKLCADPAENLKKTDRRS